MIVVAHSSCLMFGGTFDPAYILDMTAIELHCQTATNKRNAALLQTFLSDVLSVPINRGVVRFKPTPEYCLAIGGRTVAADIDYAESDNGVKASRRKSTMSTKRKSMAAPIIEKKEEKPAKEKRKSLLFIGRKNPDAGKPTETFDEIPELSNENPIEKPIEAPKKARMSLVPKVATESQRQPMSEIPQHGTSRSNQQPAKESTNDQPATNRDRRKSTHPLLPNTNSETAKSAQQPVTLQTEQHSTDRNNTQKPPRDAPFSAPRSRDPLSPTGPPFLNHSRPSTAPKLQSIIKTTSSGNKASPTPKLIKIESAVPIALPPPPIPQNNTPTPKMSKRKSLIGLFRRDTVKAVS
jgi:Macrophage migration inhibitory factor (MIF)